MNYEEISKYRNKIKILEDQVNKKDEETSKLQIKFNDEIITIKENSKKSLNDMIVLALESSLKV